MLALLNDSYRQVQAELGCEAVNVGINSGRVVGQTIDHAHIHLIPRYDSDASEPAGGVRWLFPEKARYWGSSSGGKA